jgi:predicted RNA polymerase sigma factor
VAASYLELEQLTGSPVVRLNRAVAVAEADGAPAGFAALAGLDESLPRFRAVTAYLHEKAGDLATAATEYAEAARLATSTAERDHLTRQAARLNHAVR